MTDRSKATMADSRASENDPVERFLGARFPGAVNVELRQTLLARTTQVLQRRRRFKGISYGIAMVGCYLLGLATMQVRLVGSPTTTGTAMVLPDSQATAERKAALGGTLAPEHAHAALSVDHEP